MAEWMAQAVLQTRKSTDVSDLDALFRGFADPTRIRILNLLAAGEMCVCDLVELLEMPQPTVSRHLAYLRETGLVEYRRASNYAHYRLSDPQNHVHESLIRCVGSCFTGIKSLDSERRRAVARVKRRAKELCG
jgi:ArsR family transcriptional regulator, arsenate/arsenite/antimonite-responsive transcriptional repressor